MSAAGSKVSGLDTANLPLPAIKPGLRTKAVYVTKSNRGGEVISKEDMELANTDILTFREEKTPEMLRKLAVASPSISSSVDAYIRTAITESYTLVAYNMDGSFNVEATTSLQQIVKRMDVLKNYDEGFNTTRSIRSLSESLAKDLRIHGSCACELVLDEAYMPTRIQPISVTQIEFKIQVNVAILMLLHRMFAAITVDLKLNLGHPTRVPFKVYSFTTSSSTTCAAQ